MKTVLVGATGAVGRVMLRILEERDFPADELLAVASARSAGRKLPYGGGSLTVDVLEEKVFDGAGVALFDVPDEVARRWAPIAAARGAVAIDNSAAWRLHEEVPLVVPEINPEAAARRPLGIIASANCTVLAMVVPLAPLHREASLRRVVAASYQAASGAGRPGVEELWDQTERVAKEEDVVVEGLARDILEAGDTFGRPLAMNVIPQCGSFKEDGHTSEELKLGDETRKILDQPELRVSATCVRVPVVIGHSVAVHAEFDRPITPDAARRLLRESPGVEVVDDPDTGVLPTPLEAAGRDPCYVGRIRQDPDDPRALQMFCVADNLRKGAALNTVQIAELITR